MGIPAHIHAKDIHHGILDFEKIQLRLAQRSADPSTFKFVSDEDCKAIVACCEKLEIASKRARARRGATSVHVQKKIDTEEDIRNSIIDQQVDNRMQAMLMFRRSVRRTATFAEQAGLYTESSSAPASGSKSQRSFALECKIVSHAITHCLPDDADGHNNGCRKPDGVLVNAVNAAAARCRDNVPDSPAAAPVITQVPVISRVPADDAEPASDSADVRVVYSHERADQSSGFHLGDGFDYW